MKETLNYLFENNTLSKKEAKSILLEIGQGKHNNSQIACPSSILKALFKQRLFFIGNFRKCFGRAPLLSY